MNRALIALTMSGFERAKALRAELSGCEIYVPPRFAAFNSPEAGGVRVLEPDFQSAVKRIFSRFDALIFFSAVSVAVRAIAPYLAGKDQDPAVVVIDDGGRYAISLLSGHLGGANELALKVADLTGAEAIITTATDGRKVTAFDDLSRRFGWAIENLPVLKDISAALLEEREVLLYSDQAIDHYLQGRIRVVHDREELLEAQHGSVVVSSRLVFPFKGPARPCLVIRPRSIAAGVGCRRGVAKEAIMDAVIAAFKTAGLSVKSLSCLASGEFKSSEPGLIEAAKEFHVPFKTFSREDIKLYTQSEKTSSFVESQVGVGAVAEPCAILGSEGGSIVQPVIKGAGITVALAEGTLIPEIPA